VKEPFLSALLLAATFPLSAIDRCENWIVLSRRYSVSDLLVLNGEVMHSGAPTSEAERRKP